MYQEVVFIHVLSALIFFLAHGASAAMVFKVPGERRLERLRAYMELSSALQYVMYVSLLLLLIAGIVAGIMGNWWSQGWIGASLLLLIALSVWMGYYRARHYDPLRTALGMPNPRQRNAEAPEPASDEEIYAIGDGTSPWAMMGPAFLITAVILWLMMYKPF